MAYSNPWDNSLPLGSTSANHAAADYRKIKVDVSERMISLGVTGWDTDDPVGFNNINTTGASPALLGGTVSFLVKDNLGLNTNWTFNDNGDTVHNRGIFTFDDSSIVANAVNASNTIFDAGSITGGVTIDWNNGNNQKVTLIGACTFTFTNPQIGAFYTLQLTQDATGTRLATWPALAHFPATLNIALTTTANHLDLISFYWNGSIYLSAFSCRDITP